jgi:hypothetical protein
MPGEKEIIEIQDTDVEDLGVTQHENLEKKLGSRGKLVKSWRLTGISNDITVQLERHRSRSPSITVGVYLDPDTGFFYGRVPEIEDGALYISKDLNELRGVVLRHAALEQLERDQPVDVRIWTQFIRVFYPSPVTCIPDVAGGPDQGSHSSWIRTWSAPGFFSLDDLRLSNRENSDQVGPLSFVRLEYAVRSDGMVDVREWEEDYRTRLERWQKESLRLTRGGTEQHTHQRPSRATRCENAKKDGEFGRGVRNVHRDLPWSQELWGALFDFRRRVRDLDGMLRDFLLKSEVDDLIGNLIAGKHLLLTADQPAADRSTTDR